MRDEPQATISRIGDVDLVGRDERHGHGGQKTRRRDGPVAISRNAAPSEGRHLATGHPANAVVVSICHEERPVRRHRKAQGRTKTRLVKRTILPPRRRSPCEGRQRARRPHESPRVTARPVMMDPNIWSGRRIRVRRHIAANALVDGQIWRGRDDTAPVHTAQGRVTGIVGKAPLPQSTRVRPGRVLRRRRVTRDEATPPWMSATTKRAARTIPVLGLDSLRATIP